ncbi:CidA/LrgA family protein [Bradyrhizobium sp. STM 3562]|uniref:CidA/LrgA family protein n=1 Tax=Bradyrhizobium sp. STM 3562 TaxID=578924 RepID=UPI00388F7270
MSHRNILVLARHRLRRSRLLQIALMGAFWLAGEEIARICGLPVPGGIVGMALALAVLCARGLKVASMKRGADWLLAEMLLFFVPAVLALLDHREFMGLLGLKILAIILVSTTAVMCVTALTVDFCYRWSDGDERTRPVA